MVSAPPPPVANPAAALAHLRALFGRALTGRIELTAIRADKAGPPRTRFFDPGELEEAAAWGLGVNRERGWNLYVGAALRRMEVFPGKAADDRDVLQAWALWADADTEAQFAGARGGAAAAGARPWLQVITGRRPEKRAQLWWPLETPVEDAEELRALARGIAAALGTDPKVCTAKQLMRLAGSLAWPKPNKPGRVLETTELVLVAGGAAESPVAVMARAFPPVVRAAAPPPPVEVQADAGGGRIMDGREDYAFRLVRGVLHELIGTEGAEPSAEALYRAAAPVFLRKVDQVRPGRGPAFLRAKCEAAIRAFRSGQIPFMRDLEEAVQSYAAGVREGRDAEPPALPALPASRPFRASSLAGEPPPRRWIVRDWIVEGAVNSLYGDGGLGKTLLAQQLACAVATGTPWLGQPTARGRVLAVLCEDDRAELWRRQADIARAMGEAAAGLDDAWLWPRVGEDNGLVRWDRDGRAVPGAFAHELAAGVAAHGPALLILDTLADVFGGNEIDRVQVNYFVKTVLGGMIKARRDAGFPLTVLLLGHPSVGGKGDGRGFSGSTAWSNAVRSRLYLTRPDDGGGDERILTRGKANYAASGDETALRLVYADGVLKAQAELADGDSLLWGAMREAAQMVGRAWAAGTPFTGAKGTRKYLYAALPAELARRGFRAELARQAVRACVEDQWIGLGRSNTQRGYRSFRDA